MKRESFSGRRGTTKIRCSAAYPEFREGAAANSGRRAQRGAYRRRRTDRTPAAFGGGCAARGDGWAQSVLGGAGLARRTTAWIGRGPVRDQCDGAVDVFDREKGAGRKVAEHVGR